MVGYDDGSGAGSPGDGKIEYDEIQYTIGECPGDSGVVAESPAGGDASDWGPSLFVDEWAVTCTSLAMTESMAGSYGEVMAQLVAHTWSRI